METLFVLLVIQGALGAFDTLYHHELTERLPWRAGAALELRIHAVRNAIYAVIFFSLGWLEWHGPWAWIFAALLLIEVVLTLWDFLVEDAWRRLPASERVTHTVLALNYGVILGLLLPVVMAWAGRPAAVVVVGHGLLGWIMTAFAVGAMFWALRDGLRSLRLSRPAAVTGDGPAVGLPRRLSVLITGGTGFIGARLAEVLIAGGHEVTVLTRDKAKARDFRGRVTLIDGLHDLRGRANFDAIVNLAGEPVADGRWSAAKKRRILDSRVSMTSALVRLMAASERRPKVLISASAVGFYGSDAERAFKESSAPAPGFTHDVCRACEAAALAAEPLGVRVCLLRIGIVLGSQGGAMARMLPAFEFGLGGPMGNGRQWVSWIHLDDVVGLILHAIADDSLSGAINATAPRPVRNKTFAKALGWALRRPAILPTPGFALRLLFGEMAQEVLLTGQKVLPERAAAAGYRFRYPTLHDALSDILGRPSR
jgi:uncharacterized protein (TIGR01777 family)